MVGSDALQSIVYARGSLRLLDQVRLFARSSILPLSLFGLVLIHSGLALLSTQRKLPLQVDYIGIEDSTDGW
jgi:hypothetical protein